MIRTLKEFARHALHTAGVRRKLDHLKHPDRGSRFADIYRTGVWTHGDASVPGSGHGSSLQATGGIRERLPELLAELGTQRLLDVGCGDFTWMSRIDLPCSYIGVDIVSAVVQENERLHGSPTRAFLLADSVTDRLPDADTVLCREVLFHLSFADAMSALKNIVSQPRRFVILTTDKDTAFNADIESGDFRLLNLERKPFRLPPPLTGIPDDAVASRRLLGVWRAEEIRKALG